MPDILVFGATGYTGRLTAHALYRRGARFAIAGRDFHKLSALARSTGAPDVRIADVDDIESLVRALHDVRALITCVGPFVQLGATAVEAALRARVHYLDSSGEGEFVGHLVEEYDGPARDAGIAMAPCMGFDEVPADVASTLAASQLERPEVTVTYALPSLASRGTLKSALGILSTPGTWLVDGRRERVDAGRHKRWAPMPPPLGPRASVSFPFAINHLAPLHLDLRSFRTYATVGGPQGVAVRAAGPALRALRSLPGGRAASDMVVEMGLIGEGPDEEKRRGKWTVLAEARDAATWRNVALVGSDPYGLTAELLASCALEMVLEDYDRSGVVAPVQAVDVDFFQKVLLESGTSIESYGPT
jgi:short subunit dehydrogenase-like uncharacterized protein